jgi:hypothetical protein
MISGRFDGLFGDVRVRAICSEPARRTIGRFIFALGGYGIATGLVEDIGNSSRLPWFALLEGDSGEEMNGMLLVCGLILGSRRKSELLDGERDRERRNCLIAELAST